jgi:hypothetical protein
MRLPHLIMAAILVAAPVAAAAHDIAVGPNGGQVIDDKGHHLEFTVKGQEIVLYLSDEQSKPIASKGASGRIVVQSDGAQATAALMPADPNLLTARLQAPPAKGAKVVVSAKLGDGHDVQARFVVR